MTLSVKNPGTSLWEHLRGYLGRYQPQSVSHKPSGECWKPPIALPTVECSTSPSETPLVLGHRGCVRYHLRSTPSPPPPSPPNQGQMEKLPRGEDTEATKDPKEGEAESLEKNVPDGAQPSRALLRIWSQSVPGHCQSLPHRPPPRPTCYPFTGAHVS